MRELAEKWIPIKGFPKYEISNLGRVRSRWHKVPKVLKGRPNSKGYLRVSLSAGSGKQMYFIHRLVATAFCDRVLGQNTVNHLDFNPLNNRADNLEWASHRENMRHSLAAGRFRRTKAWMDNLNLGLEKMRVPVIGINVKTGEALRFGGVNKVRELGFQPSCVSNCCKGKRSTHKGYTWFYDRETKYEQEDTGPANSRARKGSCGGP